MNYNINEEIYNFLKFLANLGNFFNHMHFRKVSCINHRNSNLFKLLICNFIEIISVTSI